MYSVSFAWAPELQPLIRPIYVKTTCRIVFLVSYVLCEFCMGPRITATNTANMCKDDLSHCPLSFLCTLCEYWMGPRITEIFNPSICLDWKLKKSKGSIIEIHYICIYNGTMLHQFLEVVFFNCFRLKYTLELEFAEKWKTQQVKTCKWYS